MVLTLKKKMEMYTLINVKIDQKIITVIKPNTKI